MSYMPRVKQYGHLEYGREDDMDVLSGDALRLAAFPFGLDRPVPPSFTQDLGSRVQMMSFDEGVSWYPMQRQMVELERLMASMRAEARADVRRFRFWSFKDRLRRRFSSV